MAGTYGPWMRVAVLAALLAGCQASGSGDLWPDEFHLWASRGDSDVSSSSSRDKSESYRTSSSGDGETTTIGGGFTWYIGAPRGHDPELSRTLILLVAELQSMRTSVATFQVPVRVAVIAEVPAAPAAPPPGLIEHEIQDIAKEAVHEAVHDAEDDAEAKADAKNVRLEGVSEDVWLRLIGALALLLTALAGYLGRQRIPVVRDWTSQGRARRRNRPDDPT